MGLSIRAYARHRGVSHVAVKKAIDTGRITPLPDGTIDPDAADAQWAQNTLQPRKAAAPQRASIAKARVLPEREVPEPGTPPLSTGGTSLLQARTVNEVLKAQLNKVELAHRKKELVDRRAGRGPRVQTRAHRARRVVELARAYLRADGIHARCRCAPDARGPGGCRARAPD
jgi:hypothetical protein